MVKTSQIFSSSVARYGIGCLVALVVLSVILPNYPIRQPSVSAQAGKPNIVVILMDDAMASDLEYMPKTKVLLADKGVTFTNSFVDFPLCCPSRASLLTGQAAHNNGIVNNIAPGGGWSVFQPQESNTIPVWLGQAGYGERAYTGKYLNGYYGTSIPPGWTKWRVFSGTSSSNTPNYYNYKMNILGVLTSYLSAASEYSTDLIGVFSKNFIIYQANPNGLPIFAVVAPYAPHANGNQTVTSANRHLDLWNGIPMPKSPSFNESDISDKPTYMQPLTIMTTSQIATVETHWRQRLQSLQAVDDVVQWVVNSLEGKGVLDNTVIIFTSDNGFMLGEHRRPFGKVLPYEESIRVPLVIRGPGIPAGQIREQLVNNLDVAASIVDWADATPGRVLDGRSLVPLLADDSTPWRTALLVQGRSGDSPETGGGAPPTWGTWKAVRTNRDILVKHVSLNGATTEYEYYDLFADPYELQNNPSSPVVPALTSILNTLENCAGSSCWVTTPTP